TEQSTALGEINAVVSQLDSMTQQNAAMVEESTAASQLLANDAEKLSKYVFSFKTENTYENRNSFATNENQVQAQVIGAKRAS
ncbi:MAG: methyl-accepting chemotaxis protein, partial [Rhodobacterales bacterium]